MPTPYISVITTGNVQTEEEGETAEVHVSLGIEFAGLHIGAVGFADVGIDALGTIVRDAPHSITRINKEEEDEYECDF